MAQAAAQHQRDGRVAGGEHEARARGGGVAPRRVPDEHVGDDERQEHHRPLRDARARHPDDGKRRLRVPGRNVEPAEWVDEARPVEQDVAGRKGRRLPRVAQGAGRGGVVLGRHIGIMLSRKGASKTRAPHLTQAYLTDGNVSVLAFSDLSCAEIQA